MDASPLLPHCPPGLPRAAYLSPDWYAQEQRAIFAREWICAGRAADLPAGTQRPLTIGSAPVLLLRTPEGQAAAWHNSCRHRGAELCAAETTVGRLVRCPYHAWAYRADTGALVGTGPARPTGDFDAGAHGLHPVALAEWAGFLFLNLSAAPGPLAPDMGLQALDNWPMHSLVTGHRVTRDLACNWKVFWENYNECLHCPGIHPSLCDMVPIYRQGIMSAAEPADGAPGVPPLKPGAVTWTSDGQPCGPTFNTLTEQQKNAGYTFVTLYPTMYVVAHVDYVRAVRLDPTGPETTRLTAEWYFPAATLAQPGFDAARVAYFALTVMDEDGWAAEVNQRGIRSPSFTRGTLMPEEFDIHRFHGWVLSRMETTP